MSSSVTNYKPYLLSHDCKIGTQYIEPTTCAYKRNLTTWITLQGEFIIREMLTADTVRWTYIQPFIHCHASEKLVNTAQTAVSSTEETLNYSL